MGGGKDPQSINTIDRILECAVLLNWKDFVSGSLPMAMQLEYRTGAPTRSLEFLKLWSSNSRGQRTLICEYWMQLKPTHQQGITFTGTHSSPGLTRMLDTIMHHQEIFSLARIGLRDGVVQIASPDQGERAAAKRHMTQTLERITSRNPLGTVSIAMKFAADHPAAPGCSLSSSV